MMKTWLIKDICHSGRKGVRWTAVDDIKYYGLVGCYAKFDMNSIKQFEGIRMYLAGHPDHSWWDTTGIIQLARRWDGDYVMETINTIYVLEEVSKSQTGGKE